MATGPELVYNANFIIILVYVKKLNLLYANLINGNLSFQWIIIWSDLPTDPIPQYQITSFFIFPPKAHKYANKPVFKFVAIPFLKKKSSSPSNFEPISSFFKATSLSSSKQKKTSLQHSLNVDCFAKMCVNKQSAPLRFPQPLKHNCKKQANLWCNIRHPRTGSQLPKTQSPRQMWRKVLRR